MVVRPPGITSNSTNSVDSGVKPLSAIAAFCNLISSHPGSELKHGSTSAFSSGNKISAEAKSALGPHSLPTEIMRMIFHCVFESCLGLQDNDVDTGINGDMPNLWLNENPLSPSLFPYALACVCVRWFRILKISPVYWTRLIITVDAISASLPAACTALTWAGHYPLKVIITMHHGASQTVDSEHERVCRSMEFLRPHISRIWSLPLDLDHYSSVFTLEGV